MKKIILIIGIIVILTSCSNPEDTKKIEKLESKIIKLQNSKKLETNILCGEKKQEYIKEFGKDKRSFGDTWFSPILNTCILEGRFYSLEQILKGDNYNGKYFIDTLEKKEIGSLEYYENFGFEGGAYLPKICNINFNNWKDSGDTIYIRGGLIKIGDVGQEIYNTEFNFENCKRLLKGLNTKININIGNLDFKYNYSAFDHIRY